MHRVRDAACACTLQTARAKTPPSSEVPVALQTCTQFAGSVFCRTHTRPAHEHGMLMACLMSYLPRACGSAHLPTAYTLQPCVPGTNITFCRCRSYQDADDRSTLAIFGSACQLCVSSQWPMADRPTELFEQDLTDTQGSDCGNSAGPVSTARQTSWVRRAYVPLVPKLCPFGEKRLAAIDTVSSLRLCYTCCWRRARVNRSHW